MQKKIIALAVAGLASTGALAQSNVTVYGIVDAYVANWSGNGQRVTGLQSSGLSTSRLGFKGVEDLGGGLKAVFNIESKLTPDEAAGNNGIAANAASSTAFASDRQLNVGLSGGFGTVLAGTMSTLEDSWLAAYDFAGNLSARVVLGSNPVGGIGASKPVAVAYVSPSFSGLTLAAANIFGEESTSATRNNALQLGANYANGPISAAYTFTQMSEADALGANGKMHGLGGSYDFGMAKLMGTWQQSKNTLATTTKNNLWQLGVVVPMGQGAIHAGYGKQDNEAGDTDAKLWTIAYSYGFSKRTTGYLGVARLGNDGSAAAVPHASFTGANGKSYTGVLAGLRHSF